MSFLTVTLKFRLIATNDALAIGWTDVGVKIAKKNHQRSGAAVYTVDRATGLQEHASARSIRTHAGIR